MNDRMIQILSNGSILPNENLTIHINYNEALTLKELSDALGLINRAINDVNRDNGIKSNTKLSKECATEVTGVDSGSIVLYLLTHFIAPIAAEVFANYLYNRLKLLGSKKGKGQIRPETAYPISIVVNGNDNHIEINITKTCDNELV